MAKLVNGVLSQPGHLTLKAWRCNIFFRPCREGFQGHKQSLSNIGRYKSMVWLEVTGVTKVWMYYKLFEIRVTLWLEFAIFSSTHRFLCCIFCGLCVLNVCDSFVWPPQRKPAVVFNVGSLSCNIDYTDSSCRFRRERRLIYGCRMSSDTEAVRTVCIRLPHTVMIGFVYSTTSG